ncbi:hypothetical protein KHA90_01845 [Flavobacterium psychroterrae]|uniref:Type VI secretion system lipoprotein TssJ n=1 Tax=Flavobacterium psychroterrae TaxID=2133767 RepID=A0ABS5P636_9FLAO|nr:hypothetical protein [Flavobacterium psychroterrae]MBS7229754.1 hypothetical protein [Flavobacterium psychroterrae]
MERRKKYNLITELIIIFLLVTSCNNKTVEVTKPIVCVNQIWYHEDKHSLGSPTVNFTIKIEDTIISKKIKSGKLNDIVMYNLDKQYSDFVHLEPFEIGRQFTEKKNIFSFKILTVLFAHSPNKNRHRWTPEEIKKAIQGDVGLVFKKDTIRVKMCEK